MKYPTIIFFALFSTCLIFIACGGAGSTTVKPAAPSGAAVGPIGDKQPQQAEATVIFEQEFEIHSPKGDVPPGGKYYLKATSHDDLIEIEESLSMMDYGKEIGFRTKVFYHTKPSVHPVSAGAETFMNGKKFMQADVAFREGQIQIAAKVTPPEGKGSPHEGEKIEDLPAGTILFQSAIAVVGPLLLEQPGELKHVVFAEFPDDLDNPINFKEDYKLVREAPGGDGTYSLKLYRSSGSLVVTVHYDENGKCVGGAMEDIEFIPVAP